jgi:excisionase family DNA binding protein
MKRSAKEFAVMAQKSTANEQERRVMTLDEVACLLRISRGSAYEAAKRKEIPTIRIGRRVLVPVDAFERLLSGTTAAESVAAQAISREHPNAGPQQSIQPMTTTPDLATNRRLK